MRIVFCLPGTSFPGRFLECWTETVAYCLQNGVEVVLSRKESCNIYYVRNMCLGAGVMRGKDQKPFDGKLDYDYLMWIDSDILWKPEQITRLISHNKDIASGTYLMAGGQYLATVKEWDEDFFARHGCFQFMTPDDLTPQPSPDLTSIPSPTSPPVLSHGERKSKEKEFLSMEGCPERKQDGLISVAYTGMGFMLVKRGVFESMEYPWFRPIEKQIGNAVDFTMEDVAFCIRARENGYEINVDPLIKVGHEKKVVL